MCHKYFYVSVSKTVASQKVSFVTGDGVSDRMLLFVSRADSLPHTLSLCILLIAPGCENSSPVEAWCNIKI